MAKMKSTKASRASTARTRSVARKPKAAAKPAHDILKEMLADVNAMLDAIGNVIANLPSHGDLHDDHVELAKSAKKLAKEAHAKVKAARKSVAKKATL
jgi:predicted glycoside hydrolase/deacetylase ChbG (UPF0249 family)